MSKCRLTERITIQFLDGTKLNDNSFPIENWVDYHPCWASKEDLSGREFLKLQGTFTENVTTFVVRYCNKLKDLADNQDTKKYRVKYKNRIYNITYAHDINNKHTMIDLKCKVIS